ncbi:MAG TPA: tRNA lysidine(34) synthetase TilS [Candidatus Angelobacter sp.]|nr:tRNA lysidine(34) synthetase TilS [Candidatus Angelobacter sp.]
MTGSVHRYIQEQGLLAAGERVAVAVSGGADSVALLRALMELRSELGVVIAVAHFHHQIRGADANEDQRFVEDLARQFDVPFHAGSMDVPAYARQNKLSLEAAARETRYSWFAELIGQHQVDKVATAHTLDDQAETILMRILRGTGTSGLTGILPSRSTDATIRPFLRTTRREIEAYLKGLGQIWREDASNQDLHHTRNLVRHSLLPMLERDFNPGVKERLAEMAEIARDEERYWDAELEKMLPRVVRTGKPSRSGRTNTQPGGAASHAPVMAVDLAIFVDLPAALQRRVLHTIGKKLGLALEFKHVEELLGLARQPRRGKGLSLPGGFSATCTFREMQIEQKDPKAQPASYQYSLDVPGEVTVPELGVTIRAIAVSKHDRDSRYNSALLLDRNRLASKLIVRNWRAGDRFFPAHTRSPRKIKELLQPERLGRDLCEEERGAWPVLESAGEIVWMRGFAVPESFAGKLGEAILIEEKADSEAET